MQQGNPSGLAKNARGGICPAGRDCYGHLRPVFSLCIFRASLREPVFFACRLTAV